MQDNQFINDYDEISIDFNKLIKIIFHRSPLIISCFILVLIFTFILTQFQPKKYVSDAQVYINKGEDTNLADINPFSISEIASSGSNIGLSNLISGNGGLNNEIEILKSPLVMEKVIRDNNLIYESGLKKGKYINPTSFAQSKDLEIDNMQGSKSIRISYKSTDPKLAYSIVNSIIKNYKDTFELINSKKASKDKEFVKASLEKATQELDKKITRMKEFKAGNSAFTSSGIGGTLGLVGMYDKRLGEDLNIIAQGGIDQKKIQADLDQEFEKVKTLKSKLEWIKLVETMSKNTSNISILKKPEIKEAYEFSEPNIKINLTLAVVFSFIFSSFLIIWIETASKKLTYSNMDENTILTNKNDIDLSNLQAKVLIKDIKDLAIVSLTDSAKTEKYMSRIKRELANVSISLTDENSSLDQHIKNIMSAENIVFIGQLEFTERKAFNELKDVCKELKKNVINTFLVA